MRKIIFNNLILLAVFFCTFLSCNKNDEKPAGTIQLASVSVGTNTLDFHGSNPEMPVDQPILISFNNQIDTVSALNSITLTRDKAIVPSHLDFDPYLKNITLTPLQPLENSVIYMVRLSDDLKGTNGETFAGVDVEFQTEAGKLKMTGITLNGQDFSHQPSPRDIKRNSLFIEVTFSTPIDTNNYQYYFTLFPPTPLTVSIQNDHKKVFVNTTADLTGYTKYYFSASAELTSQEGFSFDGFYNSFYTELDSSLKFPLLSDENLLDLVQRQTFRYFYDFAHPIAGLARERNTSGNVVTTGGSGFGVMALIVGMERGFITRQQGLDHLDKILDFLETCDRYHGAWPHWLNGATGDTYPFSTKDDGADLVETAFMIQGLMTMRQYMQPGVPEEDELAGRLNTLINGVEWDWFTRGQNVLYWHWSPNYGWAINMRLEGYNETMIAYVLAAASPTYTIPATAYHQGYAKNGGIINGNSYYGYKLPLGWPYGGPLFFTHYSHLGLDPRNLSDQYGNLWEQGVSMSLINWAYCVDNPRNWVGYRNDSWGLTASDNPWGYNAHSPTNDLGVITPTAAVSAIPYTPEQSMAAIRHFYFILGDKLWGEYGFYDAFDVTEGWWASSYIAIDQGPIVCMIENHRTGLLWDLFMSSPEVQQGLDKLGFSY